MVPNLNIAIKNVHSKHLNFWGGEKLETWQSFKARMRWFSGQHIEDSIKPTRRITADALHLSGDAREWQKGTRNIEFVIAILTQLHGPASVD